MHPSFPGRWATVCTAAGLFVGLAFALLWNNYAYLFHTGLYEFEDFAADSLQIIQAKHFRELYGQYSRWGFHHPGPAYFYVQAWGEMLFHDWLRLVPRPLNAQMLVTLLLNVFFIAAMLGTAACWVGRRTLFLPLALLLGVWHVAAITFPPQVPLGALFLIGNWPGYETVVPFAALIVVGASVAAGRGESLALLALVCCFLEHAHVAQPLFILPLSLLAYGGLILACRFRQPAASPDTGVGTHGFGRWVWSVLTAPARLYPRTHVFSVIIVGIFLLPILIDLMGGSHSNVARILAFRHAHRAEKHKLLIRSFLYFVQFALYHLYNPNQDFFGDYTAQGMREFLRANRFGCELWVGGLMGSAAVMLSWLRRGDRVAAGMAADVGPDGVIGEETAAVQARRLYTVWLWIFVAAAFALVLVWGRIMDGTMLYYNSFINYGFCYAAMLAIAAAAADFLATSGVGRTGWWTHGFLYVMLAALCLVEADRFRLGDYAAAPNYGAVVRAVDAALDAEPATLRPRLLAFTEDWERVRAVEVALELERRNVPFIVEKPNGLFVGVEHESADPCRNPPDLQNGAPFRLWQIVAPPVNAEPLTRVDPLDPVRVLVTGEKEIDPTAGAVVVFGGERPDYLNLAPVGWTAPLPDAPAIWSVSPTGQLSFHARPVPAGRVVHVTFALVPLVVPGKLAAQRLELAFNGLPQGTWTQQQEGLVDVAIPAALWNARTDAWLTFHYPDAASPDVLGINPAEHRLLAFAFRQIGFRLE